MPDLIWRQVGVKKIDRQLLIFFNGEAEEDAQQTLKKKSVYVCVHACACVAHTHTAVQVNMFK